MKSEQVGEHWEANAETWTLLSRSGYDVYRDRLNTPAFLKMLPDVEGLIGLDVGCGEGANTRLLAECGAKMSAIDIAPTFIGHATDKEQERPLGIQYQVGDGTALTFTDDTFDFVTAFMSLMDMPDQAGALMEASRVLRPSGFVQFSILHPCFVPPKRKNIKDADGNTVGVEVSDYFATADAFIDTWCFSSLPKEERDRFRPFSIPRFHRTLTDWVWMICDAGLIIEEFGEPAASEELALAEPIIADTRVTPIFLHIRARKPG